MTTLLPASLQKALKGIVERANLRGASLRAILLSTTEGVPLGRVVCEDGTSLNEEVLASIESVWAPASKQFPVLGLDKVQQVTAIYDHGTLVHIYQAPMVRVVSAFDRLKISTNWLHQFVCMLAILTSLSLLAGHYNLVWSAGQSRRCSLDRNTTHKRSLGTVGARACEFAATRSKCFLSSSCWILQIMET